MVEDTKWNPSKLAGLRTWYCNDGDPENYVYDEHGKCIGLRDKTGNGRPYYFDKAKKK